MLLPSGELEVTKHAGLGTVLFYHAEASGVDVSLCVCLYAYAHTYKCVHAHTCKCAHGVILKVLTGEEMLTCFSSAYSFG